ncbi:hypothetical protein [Pseudochrobactrum asaccharolyticum]|uniref:hypothetical protein n=1 Tax=Pseudochrobactrum asaccharolyticum TaxID=354351 RepID=UPI0040432035
MHRFISSIDRFELETGTSLVVWLTPEGREQLSAANAFEISSECGCANIKWESNKFGEQHIQIAPGGDEDQRILDYMLKNPESAIEHIETKNEELEEEAFAAATKISDVRRGLIDNTPAVLFKVNGEENCEWLDDENHMLLANRDSHLSVNGNLSEEGRSRVFEQLKDWLSENPITVEWSENKGFHGFVDGGTYDTLAEAEAGLEDFKKEFLAQCDEEGKKRVHEGIFIINW